MSDKIVPVSYSSFYNPESNIRNIIIDGYEIKVLPNVLNESVKLYYKNPIIIKYDHNYIVTNYEGNSYRFCMDLFEYETRSMYKFQLLGHDGIYFDSYDKIMEYFAEFLVSKNINYKDINTKSSDYILSENINPDIAKFMEINGYKNAEEMMNSNKPVSYSSLFSSKFKPRDIIIEYGNEKLEIKVLPNMVSIYKFVASYYGGPILMRWNDNCLLLLNRSNNETFRLNLFDAYTPVKHSSVEYRGYYSIRYLFNSDEEDYDSYEQVMAGLMSIFTVNDTDPRKINVIKK